MKQSKNNTSINNIWRYISKKTLPISNENCTFHLVRFICLIQIQATIFILMLNIGFTFLTSLDCFSRNILCILKTYSSNYLFKSK
jgi:dolichyl-phosphate-mannose--protein O-mannosyl transferase